MTTPPKPKKVVAPEGCLHYLTVEKEYNVTGCYYDPVCDVIVFHFYDDNKEKRFAHLNKSFHLGGADWIVTEYEE